MSPAPDDARIDSIAGERIAALASLYDRFAHALDPFSRERDHAEQVFQREVAVLYDEERLPFCTTIWSLQNLISECSKGQLFSDAANICALQTFLHPSDSRPVNA